MASNYNLDITTSEIDEDLANAIREMTITNPNIELISFGEPPKGIKDYDNLYQLWLKTEYIATEAWEQDAALKETQNDAKIAEQEATEARKQFEKASDDFTTAKTAENKAKIQMLNAEVKSKKANTEAFKIANLCKLKEKDTDWFKSSLKITQKKVDKEAKEALTNFKKMCEESRNAVRQLSTAKLAKDNANEHLDNTETDLQEYNIEILACAKMYQDSLQEFRNANKLLMEAGEKSRELTMLDEQDDYMDKKRKYSYNERQLYNEIQPEFVDVEEVYMLNVKKNKKQSKKTTWSKF